MSGQGERGEGRKGARPTDQMSDVRGRTQNTAVELEQGTESCFYSRLGVRDGLDTVERTRELSSIRFQLFINLSLERSR